MAKELKVSGNYVIATDLILPNQILGQFPINHCVYRENDNSFIILEQIDNEVVTIDKAQVDAGEWVDEGSTPFTQATLLTFLRDNTGFNTAGGGSPASEYIKETITFTEAELLSFSSTSPLTIKSALPTGQFYDVEKMIFKFTRGTIGYAISGATSLRVFINGVLSGDISSTLLTPLGLTPPIVSGTILRPYPPTNINVIPSINQNQLGFFLGSEGSKTITLNFSTTPISVSGGNGTLEIDVYYRVQAFA